VDIDLRQHDPYHAKDLVLKAWDKIQGAMSQIGKVKEGCVSIMTFSKARHERLFP
jgi:hypothetical protein